jgi:Zn-dependent M28 family amino/carboxypeptidase
MLRRFRFRPTPAALRSLADPRSLVDPRSLLALRSLAAWGVLACAGLGCAAAASAPADMLRAWESITGAGIARHVAVLASDEYEGREPGSAGEAKALAYVERAFREAGAAPGFGGGYRQPVPLVELRRYGTPAFSAGRGEARTAFAFQTDFIASAGQPLDSVSLSGVPLVFAGHGVTAPEFGWDDYAGVPVAGAAVILLRGDPGAPEDTALFRGLALTTHGLTLTQYENAARHGARAAIVVHTNASAGYPWDVIARSTGSAQNFLAEAKDVPRLEIVIHVSEPAARRLLASAGLDLDDLTGRANRRGFAAVATPLSADMAYTARTRAITSHNVIAKVEGSDRSGECVIYTAHWDHVGRNDSLPGDKIFNGAVDNATGTASLLEIARAWSSLPQKPRRTAYFVATTAEEKGLLGSEYLASHPIVPFSKTAAVLNLDALFPFGAFSAMTVTGLGSSELEDTLAIACARIGRVLQDDDAPQAGAYYRSDHYPFAKRGVPALFAVGNPRAEEMTDDSPVSRKFATYMTNGYHKVTDEYDAASWDMRGIEGDARVYFETGWRVANSDRLPNWYAGNEFRAVRDGMMRSRSAGGATGGP